MDIVIAEKPAIGRIFASVLGASEKKNGYLEGNGWIVSWCLGHLADFIDAEGYDPKYAKWRREDLPILPEEWKYVVLKNRGAQFAVLRKLLLRDDVDEVVNACDCAWEGERIFRTAYRLADCRKPVRRLWISSMEENAIREGFRNLKPGADYDGLYEAALCRAKADWLVGINATRLFSVLYGRTLNVGRVASPTLALVVRREAEIAAFQSVPFYHVELSCGELTLEGEKIDAKEDAASLAAACRGGEAVVRSVERKEKAEKPPALFDLTALQREANRLFGYTAQQTLNCAQSLYEKQICTYPRTDSRFLTDDMESGVPALATAAAMLCEAEPPVEILSKQVCDSRKVSDHHAILPTKNAAGKNLSSLTPEERRVLLLVCRRLLQAVSGPYRYAETVVEAECSGHRFSAKGRETLDKGWKIYAEDVGETLLPEGLAEGQRMPVDMVKVKEGQTSPPKHYTEGTLLAAMEAAGAKDMPEDADRKGLGTPATRAGILEKLVSSGFIERRKSQKITHLIPTPVGSALVAVLPETLQSPMLTAEWERRLKEVERGELAPDSFTDGIAALVRELTETYQTVPGAETLFPSEKKSVGKCPRCGADVNESKRGFFCENRACRFALWKENRFFTAKRKALTKSVAAALLKNGRVKLANCYSEKTGKTYDATVFLEDDGTKTNFRLEFENRRAHTGGTTST